MLIYPLHCRLLPPPFKMWLFSDAQGNFDPLRLLWSEAPFNRSSAQEFKLILSLPTTGSPQRFGVTVKALPRCQSCWQPAQLKAPSNAADQRDSLLMGSAPTVTGAGKDSNWDHRFFILVCGREKKTDFKLCNAVFLHFGSYYAVRWLYLKNISRVVSGIVRQWHGPQYFLTVLHCVKCAQAAHFLSRYVKTVCM